MSKVYQCDRCKATCDMAEKNDNKRFKAISIGLNAIHLCPHCMKKFEEFLSDPNCMENVEEPQEDIHYCGSCKYQFENGFCPHCRSCKDHDEWRPKETIEGISFVKSTEDIQEDEYLDDEEEKLCVGCEHFQTRYNEEPCNSCHDHEHWKPKKKDTPKIDKEESELCAKNHINSVGICVPDSEPWSSSNKKERVSRCSTCEYKFCTADLEPCKSCNDYRNWKPKEE